MEHIDLFEILTRWRKNCHRSQIANYNAANRFAKRHYCIGIPTVISSAIVATSVFAALGQKVDLYVQILVGSISVTAAILAGLQTFLKHDELALKHREIAAKYGSVKRQLDQEIAKLNAEEDISQQTVSTIREQMDALSAEGPVVPKDIWERARESIPTKSAESPT